MVMKTWDVTTLGSTMLSLSTQVGVPLLGSDNVRVDIAGAESNCAIALARLGKRVAWMSKVGRTPMGERIVSTIRAHGVDVSNVSWSEEGRNELMWVESGFGANRTKVSYDRSGAAIESLTIDDVDLPTVKASRYFHCSGITPALSTGCRETLEKVVHLAREADVKVSCDVNYRSKLWSPDEAREAVASLVPGIDLLFVGQGDLRTLWHRDGEPEEELKRLQDEFGITNVVLTRGSEGASGLLGDAVRHEAAIASDVISPIGAGDAFAAGVIFSLLNGEIDHCLKSGCAMAALARESRSDYALTGIEDLERMVVSRESESSKRLSR